MGEEAENSFLELLGLIEGQQQRPDVLLQVLQLLLQCSADAEVLQFLIKAFSMSSQGEQQQRELVVRNLRRLLRLIGGSDGRLSAMATEVLINLTAREDLAALMLAEYKDMTAVLMENLKRQQQQQQRGSGKVSEDDVPLHLGVSLMLLSNVTRHKPALDVIFSPHLPLPDYHLLPCVLLLYDAPRDPEAVYWKEQGIFLLHILRNVTACDEAVEFLLTRRMRTVNRIMDLLRYMPPLCQGPFLMLALRLACREQLHPLLLPTDHESLQKRVEEHCRRQQQPEQAEQQHTGGEAKARPEEDCRLLLALCCFLYPKPGSAQRAKARDEVAAQDAEEEKQRQRQQQEQQQVAPTEGVTERQRLRFLHPAVDVGQISV